MSGTNEKSSKLPSLFQQINVKFGGRAKYFTWIQPASCSSAKRRAMAVTPVSSPSQAQVRAAAC
eukprot:815188-Rhodomonas_salina.2